MVTLNPKPYCTNLQKIKKPYSEEDLPFLFLIMAFSINIRFSLKSNKGHGKREKMKQKIPTKL
jgi:hypothetical protein